jgi:hypothetical protein
VIETLVRFADTAGQAWRNGPVDRRILGELRGVLNRYLANLLGKRPKMHQYPAMFAGAENNDQAAHG